MTGPNDGPGAGALVLVVDDERTQRILTRDMLESCGCRVEEAADGATAVAILADHPVDLLVVDWQMPGMSGESVVQWAQVAAPRTPILLVTGWGEMLKEADAAPPGCAAVLTKPVNRDVFCEHVRRLLPGR
ncbi:MAG: response regulator [Planctomycetes bacterium]|nr:response regulator [Planctomycetota bacterium]